MNRRFPLLGLGVLLAQASLVPGPNAQERTAAAPARSATVGVPQGMLAVLELDGLAKWPGAFRSTRVSKLLADPKLGALLGSARGLLQMGIRSAPTDVDLEELYELMLEYRGRIQVGVSPVLDGDRLPVGFAAMLVMQPDPQGETEDLARIAELLSELATELPNARQQQVTVEGRSLPAMLPANHRGGFVLPQIEQGALVVRLGQPLDSALALLASQGQAGAYRPTKDLAGSALSLSVDGAQAMPILLDAMERDASRPGNAPPADRLMEVMGLQQVDRIQLALRPLAQHVALDFIVQLNGDAKGMVAMYRPSQPGPNRFVPTVPKTGAMWAAQSFRLDRLYSWFRETLALVGEADPSAPELDQLEAIIEDRTGIRLQEDLFDHFDEAIGVTFDLEGLMNTAEMQDGADGICYALRLRDGGSMLAALRSAIGEDALEAMDFEGAKVFNTTAEGVSLAFVVEDDFGILGTGESGQRMLREWLSNRAARKRGEEGIQTPIGVSERIQQAMTGWDSAWGFHLPEWLRMAERVGDELPPTAQRVLKLLDGLLAKHKLQDAVGTSGWAGPRKLQTRMVW